MAERSDADEVVITPTARFAGALRLPGDKSLSHRALIFAALSEDQVHLKNLAPGADIASTVRCLQALGVGIELRGAEAVVQGVGLSGLCAPAAPLDCGNSGTTMRLLAGVIAGAGIEAILDGDESLRGRPMGRVLEPLRRMGAEISAAAERAPLRFRHRARLKTPDRGWPSRGAPNARREEGACPPARDRRATQQSGTAAGQTTESLRGMAHRLAIASAQVKSAILLASLWADGETTLQEPQRSREHTERMLASFGGSIRHLPDGTIASAAPRAPLRLPASLTIAGDPSSAAFLAAAAILVREGTIELSELNLSTGRIGWIAALLRMGARIEVTANHEIAGEPMGRLLARGGAGLRATTIGGEEIPTLIDELPLLAVVATQAKGTTRIRDAAELRVKESDRLAAIRSGLEAMGAKVEEHEDGLSIHGPTPLRGAAVSAAGDHRIAMSLAVAALIATGPSRISGASWADVSFPGFFTLLRELSSP